MTFSVYLDLHVFCQKSLVSKFHWYFCFRWFSRSFACLEWFSLYLCSDSKIGSLRNLRSPWCLFVFLMSLTWLWNLSFVRNRFSFLLANLWTSFVISFEFHFYKRKHIWMFFDWFVILNKWILSLLNN